MIRTATGSSSTFGSRTTGAPPGEPLPARRFGWGWTHAFLVAVITPRSRRRKYTEWSCRRIESRLCRLLRYTSLRETRRPHLPAAGRPHHRAIVTFGLKRGLFVAAAADAYGYVSQADLWAAGELAIHQPFAAR